MDRMSQSSVPAFLSQRRSGAALISEVCSNSTCAALNFPIGFSAGSPNAWPFQKSSATPPLAGTL
jgi:hypothetical protein